jgi:NADPH:quinone reductase-like Zn-dependent oxidoreductase
MDNHDPNWIIMVWELTGQQGVAAAANAVRGEASVALRAVQPGGRLATITSDPPPARDGIIVSSLYVRADGEQLKTVVALLERRQARIHVGGVYALEDAGRALSAVVDGHISGAAVLDPER